VNANPNRALVVGEKYELLRSNGERDLGWIFIGHNPDGSAKFRKPDAVKQEVPMAILKEALAPKYVPFNPTQAKVGDAVRYEQQDFKIASIDSSTGLPILYQANRGQGFVNQMAFISPEQLNQYRAIRVNGGTIYANSDLSAFYSATKLPNGSVMLSNNYEYVLAQNVSDLQVAQS